MAKKLVGACYVRKLTFSTFEEYNDYRRKNPSIYRVLDHFIDPHTREITVTLCFTYNNAPQIEFVTHASLHTYILEGVEDDEVDYN